MTDIHTDILTTIGTTPIVRLNRLPSKQGAEVLVKLEAFNPAGSVKDRISLAMIQDAEQRGLIEPGDTIIEPTSGSTGIGLAMVAAVRGYKLIICMPDDSSAERRQLLEHYGATVVLTPAKKLMAGAIAKAKLLASQSGRTFMPQQFSNQANPDIHTKTTAQEILTQTGQRLDIFVAGVGTGGTITGVGSVLKAKLPDTQIVAVEPERSRALAGKSVAPHAIQGIGAGFVPDVLDRDVIDRFESCDDDTAFETARQLARQEGISAGISGGAAVAVALSLAKELEPDQRVLAMIPDGWDRYISLQQPEPSIGGLDFII